MEKPDEEFIVDLQILLPISLCSEARSWTVHAWRCKTPDAPAKTRNMGHFGLFKKNFHTSFIIRLSLLPSVEW